jgi:hypothetical protein
MRRPAVLIVTLAALLMACNDDKPEDPAPPPAVQKRTKAVWCPKQRFEQVRRDDGRFDVKRVPHGTFDARDMLGLRQQDAERLAKQNGCAMRVVERDGETLGRTDDLRVNRINVDVERGYVTALQSIG